MFRATPLSADGSKITYSGPERKKELVEGVATGFRRRKLVEAMKAEVVAESMSSSAEKSNQPEDESFSCKSIDDQNYESASKMSVNLSKDDNKHFTKSINFSQTGDQNCEVSDTKRSNSAKSVNFRKSSDQRCEIRRSSTNETTTKISWKSKSEGERRSSKGKLKVTITHSGDSVSSQCSEICLEI